MFLKKDKFSAIANLPIVVIVFNETFRTFDSYQKAVSRYHSKYAWKLIFKKKNPRWEEPSSNEKANKWSIRGSLHYSQLIAIAES